MHVHTCVTITIERNLTPFSPLPLLMLVLLAPALRSCLGRRLRRHAALAWLLPMGLDCRRWIKLSWWGDCASLYAGLNRCICGHTETHTQQMANMEWAMQATAAAFLFFPSNMHAHHHHTICTHAPCVDDRLTEDACKWGVVVGVERPID